MTKASAPQAAQRADSDIRVGRTDAPEETQADRAAEAATDRMGLGYAHGSSGGDPMGDAPAPAAALRATSGGGKSLPHETRSTMERGFGRDFSHVRIHDGPAAAEGARAVGGDAYTLGSDIVFGQGSYQPESRAGAALLSHELAHTLAPDSEPTIRRGVGFWEDVARFFGYGTFSKAELKIYLDKLNGENPSGKPGADTGAIEGDFDGDNKARAVVEKKMHLDQPVRVRHLLIEEMLDGVVSEADEEAIIQILEDAAKTDIGEAHEIIRLVGPERLEDDLTGKEFHKWLDVHSKVVDAKPQLAVPLDWKINYTISGAPNALSGDHGLLLRSLAQKPLGGARKQLASDTSVTEDDQQVATDIKHPRDKRGELSVDAAPGRIEGDKVIPEAKGPQQVKTDYPLVSHHYDTAEVMLDMVYGERQAKVEKSAVTTTDGSTKGTEDANTKGESHAQKKGKHTTTGEDNIKGAKVGDSKKIEDGRSIDVKRGKAVRKGESQKKIDLEKKDSSKSDVDLTKKTTGTQVSSGNITIDLDDITFDADVKTAIKGKADVRKGEKSWVRKLVDFTKPIRRKIIDKVLKRYLPGPLSKPVTEGIEWIIDQLVDDPPDWTITLDAEGKTSVKGTVKGKVTGKWHEIVKIHQTSKTKGTVKTEGKGTIKGTEDEKKREEERKLEVKKGASRKVSRERKNERWVEKKKVNRETDIDEKVDTEHKSRTKTDIDLEHKSKAEMKGTDKNVFEAFFVRADLRVRLTGEKGRYHQKSKPGQRGGGGANRPTQQKGTGK